MAYEKVLEETVLINVQTSAAATTTVNHGVISAIGKVPLEEFDEITVVIRPSVGSVGGPWDLFFEKAVIPAPDAATQADWTTYSHALQYTAGVTTVRHATWPVANVANNVSANVDTWRDREDPATTILAADATIDGHFGKQIRIQSRTGALVTAAATFSVVMIGRRSGQ